MVVIANSKVTNSVILYICLWLMVSLPLDLSIINFAHKKFQQIWLPQIQQEKNKHMDMNRILK